MKINTYYPTPIPSEKGLKKVMNKVFFIVAFALCVAPFGFGVVIGVLGKNVFVVTVTACCLALCAYAPIWIADTKKAYIEIQNDRILVVDYYMGIRRERCVLKRDIAVVKSKSRPVRGYPSSYQYHTQYIVFYDAKRRFLFKTANLPEIRAVLKEQIPFEFE